MDRTLVLNITEQPLTVVGIERALKLVMGEKVDVVAENGQVFHSENRTIRAPSVIRLKYYVNVPYRSAPMVSRKGIFARDNATCQYCGAKAENLDHVHPRSKGGQHVWENVVACCQRCNSKKASKTLEQSGMTLAKKPIMPKSASFYVFGKPDVDWEPYLGL